MLDISFFQLFFLTIFTFLFVPYPFDCWKNAKRTKVNTRCEKITYVGLCVFSYFDSNVFLVFQVYVLSFPTKGLESLVHEKSNLALTLLVLMFVVVLISPCIFMTLIIRATRREMFLCAALIKQMEATQQAERKSLNKSSAFATASHDIRSCLAGITGWIDPCLEQATLHSDLANNLSLMKTCAADLHGTILVFP